MLYLETIEDQNGDAIEYETYCVSCAPNLNNAYPAYPVTADCVTCGEHLRDGDEPIGCLHWQPLT